MRVRRRTLLQGAVLASLPFTASCSRAADGSSQTVVGATLLSLQYPFLVTLDDAMEKEAKTQQLDLVALDPRQQTATELSQVEDLITRQVDAIVMIPVDQEASQTAAAKVNAAGIPLVLVNTRFTDDFTGTYESYVGSDDTEAGRIEGRYVVDSLPQGGDVVYLVGEYGGASTERRKTGFEEAIAGSSVRVASEVSADGSRAQAKTTMEDLLRRYPDAGRIVGVVAQNDEMALGAASAIAEAGRSSEFALIIGVEGSAAGLEAVAKGEITATVFQDAVAQGTRAMQVVADVLAGEPVDKEYSIPFELVTKGNLAEFTD